MSNHSVLKFDYKFNVVKYKTDDKFQLDKGCYDQLNANRLPKHK